MGQILENVNLALKLHHIFFERLKQTLPENNQERRNIERNLEITSVSILY